MISLPKMLHIITTELSVLRDGLQMIKKLRLKMLVALMFGLMMLLHSLRWIEKNLRLLILDILFVLNQVRQCFILP